MEEVLYFLVHRDSPSQQSGTGSGAPGGASGSRSPVFSSGNGPGGRAPTPCAGMLLSPQASPSSGVLRKWSRLESGTGSAGANVMASSPTSGVSASGLWQLNAMGFSDASCPSSPSSRFPSTPPPPLMLMSGTHATIHDCLSPGVASNPRSPTMTESPSLEQPPLPMMHSRVAGGAYQGGMQASRDSASISLHPLQATPSLPLPATVSTTTTIPESAGTDAGCVDGGSTAGCRTGAPAVHSPHERRSISPFPPPLSVISASPKMATPPPPLPAAPTNHRVRRVRSTTSLQLHTSGGAAVRAVTKGAETPNHELRTQSSSQVVTLYAASPVEVGSEGGDGSIPTASMSLSFTMPDLPATPPPPLPGFTTLEVGGAPWRISSPKPGNSTVVSLPLLPHQSIGSPRAENYAAGAPNGTVAAGCQSRVGSGHVCAGASPVSAGESPAPPTPIMINPLPRTSSQCIEAGEQRHQYRQSLLGSSVPPSASRFTTLPTPFMPRLGSLLQNTGARSLREDSAVLSRASSFTPPTMRLAQRVRRRMLPLSQAQMLLSAWHLFHTDSISGRYQAALQATASASGATSPMISLTSAAQGNYRVKNEPESCRSSSGGRLSNSRYQEYPQHLCGAHTVSEMPQPPLLGPHWLVSVNEDGLLRYEPLPSAAQSPPYMQSPPVTTTADFAFLCVPYEALARGIEPETGHSRHNSTSAPRGVSASGAGVAVSDDDELEEVAAALDTLFGLFSGARPQHLHAHQQWSLLHHDTTGAKSSFLTVNNGGGGPTVCTAGINPGSSPVQDGARRFPLPIVCTRSDDEEQRTGRDKRCAGDSTSSYLQVAAGSIVDNPEERGGHGDEMTSREVNVPGVSGPQRQVSTGCTSPSTDSQLLIPKRLQPTGCVGNETSILPQGHAVPGLPASFTEDWLVPLRQALVERTVFLLVKPGSEEMPTSTLHREGATSSAECWDVAMKEKVVQRFLRYAKSKYGVTVQPWRVITFSYRDATRARNVMLSVYAERLRQRQPHQQHGQAANLQPTSETLPQAPRTSYTGEDAVADKAFPADGADVLVACASSPAPHSGGILSPLQSSCMTVGLPVIIAPAGAQTPPNASLTSTSTLALPSLVGGSEWRRCRHDGASGSHDNADDQQEFGDLLYTLLTQELSVQPLSRALEDYKPLLECYRAAQTSAQPGANAVANATSPVTGISSQASCADATGHANSTIDEGEQALVDAASGLSGAAGLMSAVEGTATGVMSDDGVDASAAATCLHAQEVVWRSSGAAGLSSAVQYFQHAATTHRVARAAFSVMMWSWQLHSLLPSVITDTQSRRNRLRHNGRHCQHKLQGVQESIKLHLAASPAKNVTALEMRVAAGFKDMRQRFLKDLRRLFLSTASPAAYASGLGQRQQHALPFASLDALLVYDSPGLREAYRRLTRAVLQFHAFYLGGQFAFDARVPSEPSHTGQGAAHQQKLSQLPCPVSVYEQRYTALREAMRLSQLPRKTPLRMPNNLNVTPPDESCTQPGTSFPPVLSPLLTRADIPDNTAPTTAVRQAPLGSAAPTPTTTESEAEEVLMPRVEHRLNSRTRLSSRIMNAADSSTLVAGTIAPLPRVGRREPVATPHRASVEGGSGGCPSRNSLLSPSFLASAVRETVTAEASPKALRTEATATNSGMSSGYGVSVQASGSQRMSSAQGADEGGDDDSTLPLTREELQQRRVVMEHQLIAHVSQINTEIINFFLATCVAAVPHLQQNCVGKEVARVKDSQTAIVSSFTTAVRGRKDAAMAMSHLYARLEDWSAEMSHLVSVVRSRPYLEKFITHLRAVLCEDEVRALAAFRCSGDDGQDSGAAASATRRVLNTSPSPPSEAMKRQRGIDTTGIRPPPTRARASGSAAGDLRGSMLKGSPKQNAVPLPSVSSTPGTCASKCLAEEVGHRSARMLRYYIRLLCKRRGSSGSDRFSDTDAAANAQRSGVFGEMLTSPSPSRSLRSIQCGNSTLTSPRRTSRVKGGGGGRGALGLSVSLCSMSATWSREEGCLRGEDAARTQRVSDACDAKGATCAFFASPTPSSMTASSAEALAMLEATNPNLLWPPQAMVGTESSGAALDGTASPPTPAAATHHSVATVGSVWQKQLAQWRSTMTDAERPVSEAEAAPLLWIVLDTWDETLLRMPYELLLQLDTPTYAESLNRMSDELLNTQESWRRRCEGLQARIQRQLQALEGDLNKICNAGDEVRPAYVQELQAVFNAASLLIASHDDTVMSTSPLCEFPGSTRADLTA
ncbi:hypothetical protein, conserved [Leishmania tarentolae]|uniref:Uncharacterized protein n=1 Tax=Leishmania tarentolae TaxID=5689 RepID=A0A640KAH3_LEITA|nr:hypothetical protein, conserved [Leishmania tarentolae]